MATPTTLEKVDLRIPGGDWQGPIPVPDIDSDGFWAGLREGEVRIMRCQDCGYWIHPPLAGCPECLSMNVKPEATNGRGTIYSFTIVNREFAKGVNPPYAAAFVDLDEQPHLRVLTNIVNCNASDLEIGMRVQAVFHKITDEATLLFFEPEKGA
jgi:uncharacterized OB-fold protein